MSLPSQESSNELQRGQEASKASSIILDPDVVANFQPQGNLPRTARPFHKAIYANSVYAGPVKGQYSTWQIAVKPAEPLEEEEDDDDQKDPGLLFINSSGPAGLGAGERKRVRSHVMQRYVHDRKERAAERNNRRAQRRMHLRPGIDQMLGAGGFDPFNSLPVIMSRSNSRLLHYFVQHIAPLHYPHGRGGADRDPMTSRWVASAMTDTALLHSTLGSSSGHMLYYANLPTLSPVFLSGFLSHKTETIRIINERMRENSKALTDETLGAIALLITGQTCQGNYDEMNVHMRGLKLLVDMRGGLETLGMSGLLAGEVLWCDNVTAFVSSGKPLLAMPEISNSAFENFEDPGLNLIVADRQPDGHSRSSPLWNFAIKQILSDSLITAFHGLYDMTAFLDTSPLLSEHDMLVYDRKRALIQHQLANVAIPPTARSTYHITESCRLAAVIYSVFALWGFKPPMKLYGDLAKMLQEALQATSDVYDWDAWSDLLLWTLFIGGYAAFGREERVWFSTIVRGTIQSQELKTWSLVREVLEKMPVCQALWGPFEILWSEAAAVMLEGEVTVQG